MKTTTLTSDVKISAPGEAKQFSIKATAHSFEILSSALYTDKPRAIIRELCCNAYDGHVKAGKADVPFDVQLPTPLDPTLIIKDYGTGLSHDDVETLYSTYFDSTKGDSDDYIGQLGLGSKSPFSYASTFMVESRFSGVKRLYSCFKNDQGLPSIALMDTQETSEPSGMTITIAIRGSDVSTFVDVSKRVLMYFSPQPNITGRLEGAFTPHSVEHIITGDKWATRSASYWAGMSGPYVVQGFVPYPVDVELLQQHGLAGAAAIVGKLDIDITVDIGKVDVAASREGLSYTPKTINNLIISLNQIAESMYDSIQTQYDQCNSLWEAAVLKTTLRHESHVHMRKMYDSLNQSKPFTFRNNVAVDTIVAHGMKNLSTVRVDFLKIRSQSKQTISIPYSTVSGANTSDEFGFTPTSLTKVVIDDSNNLCKFPKRVVSNYLKSNLSHQVILLTQSSKKVPINKQELDQLLEQFGDPTEVISITTLPEYATPSSTSAPRTARTGQYKVFDLSVGGSTGKRVWVRKNVNVEAGGVFVILTSDNIPLRHESTNSGYFSHLSHAVKHGLNLKFLDSNQTIVGFTQREYAKLKKTGVITKWKFLNDVLVMKCKEAWKCNNYLRVHAHQQSNNDLPHVIDTLLVNNVVRGSLLSQLDPAISEFNKTLTTLHQWVQTVKSDDHNWYSTVTQLTHYLGIEPPKVDIDHDLYKKAGSSLSTTYPLLRFVTSCESTQGVEALAQYINATDKTLTHNPVV